MSWIKRNLNFPIVSVWLGAFILLSPVYLTLRAIFWGTPVLQFVPWWSYAWSTLLSGHLPLWNPLSGMGAPLMANYQSGLFYPPYWIYLLLYSLGGNELMAWGMAPLAALHLFWAGLGMAFLCRRLNLSELAQAVSGVSFCLSGYLVARLGFLSINAATAWLPWIFLFLTPNLQNRKSLSNNTIPLIVCLSMLLLAGHAQTAWYILLLAFIWSAFWGWNMCDQDHGDLQTNLSHRLRDRLYKLSKRWLILLLALILAVGICAVQLLPTAEYLSQSQRVSSVEYNFAMNYSFWPWHLLNLLSPLFFGCPATGDYWLSSSYWEDAIYIGLLPFLLALSAIVNNRKRARNHDSYKNLIWMLVLVFCIAFVFALGRNTPIFPWLYHNIPTFNMFQAPARWMIWSVFSLALLAGLGANRWVRPRGWGLYWSRLGTMGAVAISIGAGLTWFFLGGVSPSFIRSATLIGIFGAGAGLLGLTAPFESKTDPGLDDAMDDSASIKRIWFIQLKPPVSVSPAKHYSHKRWQWAVIIWVLIDLLYAGWGLNPAVDLDLYSSTRSTAKVKALLAGKRLYLNSVHEDHLKYVRFMRFNTFDIGEDWRNLRRVFLPNTNLLGDISSTGNFDPLIPGRFAEWKEMLLEISPNTQLELLKLMGVGVIETVDRHYPNGVTFSPLDGQRVRIVECAIPVFNGVFAKELILDEEIDFDHQVIVEGLEDDQEKCQPGSVSTRNNPGSILKMWSEGPNKQHFQTNSNESAWLVISDTWYPGWQGWVDGKQVKLYRANFLFMAIELPAGEHQVAIKYTPLSFYLGAGISLFSILCLVIAWQWKQKSQHD